MPALPVSRWGEVLADESIHDLTLTEALAGLAARRFTCRAYVEAFIARAEAQAHLNALVATDWTRLRADADAVDRSGRAGEGLSGIPLCFKDNIATGILPAGAGTPALKGHVADAPSPLAAALLAAGALVGASGNMHELAFGITNNNPATGSARNPWNPDMIPGGSSGGVAAAIAARLMPAGIGTDTGGSVRLPAALCGLVGYRPTIGRYPGKGIVPISHTRDTAGPMTRSVADARLLDGVITGKGASVEVADLSRIRLGVPRPHFWEDLDPAVTAVCEHSLARLAAAGATLVEVEVPHVARLNAACGFPVAVYEFMRGLPAWLAENGLGLTMRDIAERVATDNVRAMIEAELGPGAVTDTLYREAIAIHRPKLQATYAAVFADHALDALVFPTAPLPARPVGEDEWVELNGRGAPTFSTFIRNTDPGSGAGLPGISLPAGLTPDGLPVGLEFDAQAGADERLLALAAAVEIVLGRLPAPPSA
jgi:Asp-tRNAAsn/Glu-tRNAGln amidotransferase A subunit and related amidases